MARWTIDMTLKFIEEFKNTPILWKNSAQGQDYSSKHERALNDFALKFGFSISDVKKKIDNLRTHYLYYKKCEEINESYVTKWRYYKHLKFLDEVHNQHMKSSELPIFMGLEAENSSSVENSPSMSVSEEVSDPTYLDTMNVSFRVTNDMTKTANHESETPNVVKLSDCSTQVPKSLETRNTRQTSVWTINSSVQNHISSHESETPTVVKVSDCSAQVPKSLETRNTGPTSVWTINSSVQNHKSSVQTSPSNVLKGLHDEHNVYGQYLASEIRAIPDVSQRSILKAQIQILIYKANQGLLSLH